MPLDGGKWSHYPIKVQNFNVLLRVVPIFRYILQCAFLLLHDFQQRSSLCASAISFKYAQDFLVPTVAGPWQELQKDVSAFP